MPIHMNAHTYQYVIMITRTFEHLQNGENNKGQMRLRMKIKIKENLKERKYAGKKEANNFSPITFHFLLNVWSMFQRIGELRVLDKCTEQKVKYV